MMCRISISLMWLLLLMFSGRLVTANQDSKKPSPKEILGGAMRIINQNPHDAINFLEVNGSNKQKAAFVIIRVLDKLNLGLVLDIMPSKDCHRLKPGEQSRFVLLPPTDTQTDALDIRCLSIHDCDDDAFKGYKCVSGILQQIDKLNSELNTKVLATFDRLVYGVEATDAKPSEKAPTQLTNPVLTPEASVRILDSIIELHQLEAGKAIKKNVERKDSLQDIFDEVESGSLKGFPIMSQVKAESLVTDNEKEEAVGGITGDYLTIVVNLILLAVLLLVVTTLLVYAICHRRRRYQQHLVDQREDAEPDNLIAAPEEDRLTDSEVAPNIAYPSSE